MLVLACCVVQELITFKRKSFDFTVAILLLLISFESLVAISTHSVYMPYAHNSYIEYLYDYGTVGLILLLVFIIALIVSTIDMVRRKARFAPVM